MTKHVNTKQTHAFVDLLSEEVMSLSDEEILARAKEDGVDVNRNYQAFQALVRMRLEEAKLSRLDNARKAMESQATMASSTLGSLSLDEMKQRFAELIAVGLVDRNSRLSMSFRSGKEVSEEDLRTSLEDYEEIKKLQDGDEPDLR